MPTDQSEPSPIKIIFKSTDVHYICVGSRRAPVQIVSLMERLSSRFAELGFSLRTMNNSDVDEAAFQAAKSSCGKVQVFIPWKDNLHPNSNIHITPTKEGFDHCNRINPLFDKMNQQSKLLKARVSNLLFGPDMENKARFIVCWSEDGAENYREITRHTGEITDVIEMNPSDPIPVFNFRNDDAMTRLTVMINLIKSEPKLENMSNSSIDYFMEIANNLKEFGVEKMFLHPVNA